MDKRALDNDSDSTTNIPQCDTAKYSYSYSYSLSLFDFETGDSVFDQLYDDSNMSLVQVGSGDILNEGFKPRFRSKLEETIRLDVTDHVSNNHHHQTFNGNRTEHTSFYKPPGDVLRDKTSPFPVHENNLKPKGHYNGYGRILNTFI